MPILERGQKEVTIPSLRLTRRAIDKIPFAQIRQVLYRDTMLPGFGFRVGAQSKLLFAEGQVYRRTRRVTIGRADVFAPEVARQMVLKKHQDIGEKYGETTANNVMRHFRSIYNFVAATHDNFPPNPV